MRFPGSGVSLNPKKKKIIPFKMVGEFIGFYDFWKGRGWVHQIIANFIFFSDDMLGAGGLNASILHRVLLFFVSQSFFTQAFSETKA